MSRLLVLLLLAGVAVTAVAKDKEPKLLRHLVAFKFKESVTREKLKEVEQAFAALPGKIGTIVDFEWGTDVSEEGKAKGFTHCFFVSFKDKAGRAVYLPHPAHLEFVKLVGPTVEDVFVLDYFTR